MIGVGGSRSFNIVHWSTGTRPNRCALGRYISERCGHWRKARAYDWNARHGDGLSSTRRGFRLLAGIVFTLSDATLVRHDLSAKPTTTTRSFWPRPESLDSVWWFGFSLLWDGGSMAPSLKATRFLRPWWRYVPRWRRWSFMSFSTSACRPRPMRCFSPSCSHWQSGWLCTRPSVAKLKPSQRRRAGSCVLVRFVFRLIALVLIVRALRQEKTPYPYDIKEPKSAAAAVALISAHPAESSPHLELVKPRRRIAFRSSTLERAARGRLA